MDMNVLKQAKERVAERKVGDETVLVPLKGNVADLNEMFTLNEVGSFIWENLSADASIEGLTRLVTQEFDVDRHMAEADIRLFLQSLETYLKPA